MGLTTLVGVAPARAAAPPEVRGTIVKVEGGELFVDIGRAEGLAAGDTLQVFRRIEIKHPVTRRVLVDRFPTGTVTIAEAGHLLSIVDTFGELDPPPQVGDHVVVGERPRGRPPVATAATTAMSLTGTGATTPCAPAAPCPAQLPTVDGAEVDSLTQVYEATLGLLPKERIVLWEGWLRKHPTSARAASVRNELAALREVSRRYEQPVATADKRPAPPRTLPLTTRFAAPSQAVTDQPISIYIAILEREEVTTTRLLVRRGNDKTYTRVDLVPDGRLGQRAHLGAPWNAAGAVNVRVETVRSSGEVDVITGPSDHVIIVSAPERDVVDERGRSRASTRVDWMSFWVDDDNDQYLRFETDFRYRIGQGYLEAFRMGVGLFKGRGGPTDLLDAGTFDGESRSVNYGFAEVELAIAPLFGLAGRLTVGSYQPTDEREPLASLFGGAVEARIGELDKTRLYGGVQSTEHIGDEFWLRVAIEEVTGWPMEASVLVTNLPVGADYGVSLGYGITWQANDLFALSLRLGWNARTINHSGFTAGTGVVLTW